MWARRPRGQLAKVAEANALRIAFPEEAGAEYTAEEMEGQAATGRSLESIDGEFETDLEDLNKRLGHKPAAETRQAPPPAAKLNGERRPPSRTRLLAAALKLIERAEAVEDLMDIEAEIEELPTGGGTRKTAREAWELKMQDLQPEPEDADEAEEDRSAWITDPDAARDWQKILGRTDYIPIRSPLPILGNLPGLGETPVYMLQLDQLTAEERGRLIDYLSDRFGVDKG
jgi:hypothetical protein